MASWLLSLQSSPNTRVDMLEALPTPFGLLRYGVAPDHQDIKKTMSSFHSSVGMNPNFNFYGNVRVGNDVSLDELRATYDAVVLAVGSSKDRMLQIPGEEMGREKGIVHGASTLTNWYNGFPSPQRIANFKLHDIRSVAVIGAGNVALDVARILSTPVDRLMGTDIPSDCVKALENSSLKDIHIIARRGPIQAAFTTKELRDLTSIPGVQICVSRSEEVKESITNYMNMPKDASSTESYADQRAQNRKMKVLLQMCEATPTESAPGDRRIIFHFEESPLEIQEQSSEVGKNGADQSRLLLPLERQVPQTPAAALSKDGKFIRSTGAMSPPLAVDMVITCVGYVPSVTFGLPLTEKGLVQMQDPRGCIRCPEMDGKHERMLSGLYAAGWFKRGASGTVLTNREDAAESVAVIEEDWLHQPTKLSTPPEEPPRWQQQAVTYNGWRNILEYEQAQGQVQGKVSAKILSVSEQLRVAEGKNSSSS